MIQLQIWTYEDRERPVGELWMGTEHLGVVSHEEADFKLEVYPPGGANILAVDLDEFLEVLQRARKELTLPSDPPPAWRRAE